MVKVYPSKKSIFLGSILWTSILVPTIIGIYEFQVALIIIMLLTDALVGIIWFGTKYKISENHLLIFLGPIRITTIDIFQIKDIKKSRSVMSSPANSFKRIEITYNKFDSILISPMNQKNFLEDLKSINTNINILI